MTTRIGRAMVLGERDNVATALEEIVAGTRIEVGRGDEILIVEAQEKIPFAFKVALVDIRRGELIYKYGEIIGRATADIRRGHQVHVHNIEGTRGRGDVAGEE